VTGTSEWDGEETRTRCQGGNGQLVGFFDQANFTKFPPGGGAGGIRRHGLTAGAEEEGQRRNTPSLTGAGSQIATAAAPKQ